MSRTPFSNVNNIHVHSMIPEDQTNMTRSGLISITGGNKALVNVYILTKNPNNMQKRRTE